MAAAVREVTVHLAGWSLRFSSSVRGFWVSAPAIRGRACLLDRALGALFCGTGSVPVSLPVASSRRALHNASRLKDFPTRYHAEAAQ